MERGEESYRPWRPADDARLAELWAENRPMDEIAGLLGRTLGAIRSRSLHLRLPKRSRIARPGGASFFQAPEGVECERAEGP